MVAPVDGAPGGQSAEQPAKGRHIGSHDRPRQGVVDAPRHAAVVPAGSSDPTFCPEAIDQQANCDPALRGGGQGGNDPPAARVILDDVAFEVDAPRRAGKVAFKLGEIGIAVGDHTLRNPHGSD